MLRSFGTSQCLSRKCLPTEEEGFLCSLMCSYKCHSKTRPQQTSFASNLKILATRFKTPYGLYTVHVFVSHKIKQDLKLYETKPPVVNQQCLVYKINLNVTYAIQVTLLSLPRHLYQRIEEHKKPFSLHWQT